MVEKLENNAPESEEIKKEEQEGDNQISNEPEKLSKAQKKRLK